MNPANNLLFNTTKFNDAELDGIYKDGAKPVPRRLRGEARKQLGDNASVIVTDKKSPLAKWAARVRRNQGHGE